jgi:hypothetical protein
LVNLSGLFGSGQQFGWLVWHNAIEVDGHGRFLVSYSCFQKGGKKRVWAVGTALKFGVELAAHHKGVVGQFGNFYQTAVWR